MIILFRHLFTLSSLSLSFFEMQQSRKWKQDTNNDLAQKGRKFIG